MDAKKAYKVLRDFRIKNPEVKLARDFALTVLARDIVEEALDGEVVQGKLDV